MSADPFQFLLKNIYAVQASQLILVLRKIFRLRQKYSKVFLELELLRLCKNVISASFQEKRLLELFVGVKIFWDILCTVCVEAILLPCSIGF